MEIIIAAIILFYGPVVAGELKTRFLARRKLYRA